VRNYFFIPAILLFFILIYPALPVDQSIEGKIKKGYYLSIFSNDNYIDWSSGYIAASAKVKIPRIIFNSDHPDYKKPGTALSISDARAVSREKARELAELKLMEMILSMNMDSEDTVRHKMQKDSSFRDRMGFLSSKFKIKSVKSNQGFVTIELAIPFTGSRGFYSVIIGNYYNTESIPAFPKSDIRHEISGIIIDLSEFENYKPVLEPRIFTDQGRLIYGPETLRPEIAVQRGMVSYHTDHDRAVADNRSGLKPYYLYASYVKNGNIYLDSEEVKRILSSSSGVRSFQMAKIVLILHR